MRTYIVTFENGEQCRIHAEDYAHALAQAADEMPHLEIEDITPEFA